MTSDSDIRMRLRQDKLALLSAVGSVASIFALGIVLLDKATSGTPLDPQLAAWRLIFFLVSLLASGGAVLFTYLWTKDALADQNQVPHRKVLKATLRIAIGLLLVGVCLDGIYAAIYWKPWLRALARLFRMFYSH